MTEQGRQPGLSSQLCPRPVTLGKSLPTLEQVSSPGRRAAGSDRLWSQEGGRGAGEAWGGAAATPWRCLKGRAAKAGRLGAGRAGRAGGAGLGSWRWGSVSSVGSEAVSIELSRTMAGGVGSMKLQQNGGDKKGSLPSHAHCTRGAQVRARFCARCSLPGFSLPNPGTQGCYSLLKRE